jgi:pimeloyl-ACP methyl ester carboxylesterase
MNRRSLLGLAALATVSPQLFAVPRTADWIDENWIDASRDRQVPVRIRVPTGSNGPWPILLYSHGLGGNRNGGSVWGDAWRDAGYVVVHMQHPGSDSTIWAGGREAFRNAMTSEQIGNRMADVSFVLDQIEQRSRAGDSLWARAVNGQFGLAGHSMGAQTTLAVAGMKTLAGRGRNESRVVNFVALSPAALAPPGMQEHLFDQVRGSVFCLTGTADGDVGHTGASPENRQKVFEILPAGHKYELLLQDGDHMTFGGQARGARGERFMDLMTHRSAASKAAEQAHHALISVLTTRYWNARLKQDMAQARLLASPSEVSPPNVWKSK